MYQEYSLLRDTFARYREFLSTGDYEYPDAPISDQLSDVVDGYFYSRLTAENLSSVSATFDEFRPKYDELNQRFGELSSRYTDLTAGDFRIYLDKTDCKYSYEDNVYGSTYRHDDYNDHFDKYNSIYLVDKFGDLRTYAEGADNIVTHQVVDTLEYVQQELHQLSANLDFYVGQVLEKYGYIDVNSASMGAEMDSMDAFIGEYVQVREDAIGKQIAEVREQAGKLKTTYDQLEASLDNALANYNEGHVPIGSTSANLFGECINKRDCGREKYHMKDGGDIAKIRKKYGNRIEDIVVGYLLPSKEGKKIKQAVFYKLFDDDSGDYDRFSASDSGSTNCAIDPDDNIYEKISKATTWMHQVTSALIVTNVADDEQSGTEYYGDCELDESTIEYGYCNPGVEAALNSIQAAMTELEKSYRGVVSSLVQLGYEFDASGYIGDNINDLLRYLASELNENFSLDPVVGELLSCRNTLIVYRSQFSAIEHEYQTLGEFEGYRQELTYENIDTFRRITQDIDSKRQAELLDQVNDAISEYYTIQAAYNVLAGEIHGEIPTYYPQATHLELELEDMWGALLGDIENRRDAGMQVVNARMDDMRYYVSVLKNYIPDELGSDEGFEDAIQAKLDELDYFNWDSYRENYEVFRTYSSSSVGYEPYYNHKNLTHSSYQIHPFLWRFVRASRMKDVMSRSFDSFFNDRLEIGNIAGHLDSIIGRFGEVVDIWLNNTIDFSGYTTRYEMSEHVGTNVGYSPVVDYDGAFYPPAVEEYVKSPATAAKTVRDAMTKASFVSECVQPNVAGEVSSKDALAAALSAGFGYFADFDPNVYANAVDERIPLSSAPHFNNIQKTLVDVLPETFFGKYYSHL